MEIEFEYRRMPARIKHPDSPKIYVDGYPWPNGYEYNIEEGWAKGYCRTWALQKPPPGWIFTAHSHVDEDGHCHPLYFTRYGKIEFK